MTKGRVYTLRGTIDQQLFNQCGGEQKVQYYNRQREREEIEKDNRQKSTLGKVCDGCALNQEVFCGTSELPFRVFAVKSYILEFSKRK